jgi:hypothetical protein
MAWGNVDNAGALVFQTLWSEPRVPTFPQTRRRISSRYPWSRIPD